MATLRDLAESLKLRPEPDMLWGPTDEQYNAGIEALVDALENSTELEVVDITPQPAWSPRPAVDGPVVWFGGTGRPEQALDTDIDGSTGRPWRSGSDSVVPYGYAGDPNDVEAMERFMTTDPTYLAVQAGDRRRLAAYRDERGFAASYHQHADVTEPEDSQRYGGPWTWIYSGDFVEPEPVWKRVDEQDRARHVLAAQASREYAEILRRVDEAGRESIARHQAGAHPALFRDEAATIAARLDQQDRGASVIDWLEEHVTDEPLQPWQRNWVRAVMSSSAPHHQHVHISTARKPRLVIASEIAQPVEGFASRWLKDHDAEAG